MSKTSFIQLGRSSFWLCGLLFSLTSCGQPAEVKVETTRVVEHGDRVRRGATHAERFGVEDPAGMPGMTDTRSASDKLRERLAWDIPPGWEELAAGGMRLASLRPAGNADADCSLIILEGGGGGLLSNVNRWRGQLGLADMSATELAALPTMNLLGEAGVLVDMDGTYTGMGGPERPNWNMRGVILEGSGVTIFLKMTAPKELALAEREAFDDFCASLRFKSAPAAPAAGGAGPLSFATPVGWTDVGPKSMRAVNLQVGESQCFVILLGGEAGGLLNNLNRWRGEVGLDPMDAADSSDLEQVSLLGSKAPLLDVRGDYSGMGDGGGANYRMFGVPLIRSDVSVFVKMVGPEEEMAQAREAFIEFLLSLEEA